MRATQPTGTFASCHSEGVQHQENILLLQHLWNWRSKFLPSLGLLSCNFEILTNDHSICFRTTYFLLKSTYTSRLFLTHKISIDKWNSYVVKEELLNFQKEYSRFFFLFKKCSHFCSKHSGFNFIGLNQFHKSKKKKNQKQRHVLLGQATLEELDTSNRRIYESLEACKVN